MAASAVNALLATANLLRFFLVFFRCEISPHRHIGRISTAVLGPKLNITIFEKLKRGACIALATAKPVDVFNDHDIKLASSNRRNKRLDARSMAHGGSMKLGVDKALYDVKILPAGDFFAQCDLVVDRHWRLKRRRIPSVNACPRAKLFA